MFKYFVINVAIAEHVMVQMFPYLLLPNSQLYSSEAAAAIARWEGAGMQLYKKFIIIVKNYYHYYHYLTYLALLSY